MARSIDSQRSESQRLGDFEIVREIGRGGMGVVYEAIQLSLNRPVALKVLPPGATPEQRDIERFQREAQAAAALNHSNIVPIYAQGEEEGTYYYAMRLVPGRALDKVIRDVRGMGLEALPLTDLGRSIVAESGAGGALAQAPTERLPAPPPARRPTDSKRSKTYLSLAYFRSAARLMLEVAEALEYAHSQGVIHRDVKPQNLILTPEGHLVITDFGLARFLSAPSITISGEMMGTLAYMSPEQVRAEQQRIDRRTDIYSLGVTLYEVLALELPFRADTREAMLREILLEDPPPLRRLDPRIPRDLETICAKAIEKDPSRRYQSAKDFADDLYCFVEGLPIAARPVGPLGRLYRRALRHRALSTAVMGLLLVLIVGAYLVARAYLGRREEQRWRLLAEARSLMEATSYGTALGRLKDAASIRHDQATKLAFWLLADRWSDRATVTWKHTFSMSSIAFSPDGKTLAGGCKDGTVKLWELAAEQEAGSPTSSSGSPLSSGRSLSGHGDWVTSVAFGPDGRTVASGSRDSRIRLWDVATEEELHTLSGHTDGVASVAFSPDGVMLGSASADDTVRLWEVSTGRAVSALTGHTDDVTSVAFSPDGRTLASASLDGTIRLWDRDTGGSSTSSSRQVRTLAGHAGGVNSVAFSPDGRTLASGSADNTIRLWDVESGQQLRELRGHQLEVNSVAFSPDGTTVASASLDRTVRLWDAATGGVPRTLAGHTGSVVSVAFGPDGTSLVSTSADSTTRLWEAVTGRARVLKGHGASVDSVDVSPDGGTLASASEDGTVRLWDLNTGGELHTLGGHTDRVMSVAFSPDGLTLASGSRDRTIRLWDVVTGDELGTLTGHVGGVSSLAFSPDGATLVSGSLDEGGRLWDVAGRREIPVAGTYAGVYAVAFSPDGTALALAGRHSTLKVWDVATGDERCTLSGHTDSVWCVAFSPSGRIVASGSRDQTIRLWDVDGKKGPLTLTGHTGSVFPVLFSPDGQFLVSGSLDETVRLWDVATGRQIGTIFRPPGYRKPLAFSPDGRFLVCTVGADILIYDLHAYDEDTQRWLRSVSSHVGCAGPRAQPTTEQCCWLGFSLLSAPTSRQQALRVASAPCLFWRPSHVTRHLALRQVDAAPPEDRGTAAVAQVLLRHRGPTADAGGIINPVLVGDPPFLVQPSPVRGRGNELKRELHRLALPWLVLGLTEPSMKSWI